MIQTPKTPLLPDEIKEEIIDNLEKELNTNKNNKKNNKKNNIYKDNHSKDISIKNKENNNTTKLKDSVNISDTKTNNTIVTKNIENHKTKIQTVDTNIDKKQSILEENNIKTNSKDLKNIDDTNLNTSLILEKKKSTTKFKILLSLSIVSILLIILTSIFTYFTYKYSNYDKICNNIYIKNIDVSNLSIEEATIKLEEYISTNIPEYITLVHEDSYEVSIQTATLEPTYDISSLVEEAYLIGKDKSFIENGLEIFYTLINGTKLELDISINEEVLLEFLEDISHKLPDTVIESSYYIEDDNLIIRSGSEGYIVNVDLMKLYIKNGISNLTFTNRSLKIETLLIEPATIDIYEIYANVYSEAINASYSNNPYTFTSSQNGIDFAISFEEAEQMLMEVKEEYIIPLQVLYPEIDNNSIASEAFPDTLSTFTTYYSTSNTARTTNLILAAEKINGTVIMPGELFSFNNVVGARTIEAGYQDAAMYVDGEVVDGLGGGICQVTSTLYNACLYANLEIVSRSNHQFIPSYVSGSLDATVVYGAIDYTFENNRDYPIKINCYVSGGVCYFEIKGLSTENDYDVEILSTVTATTDSYIYTECYKILRLNGTYIGKYLVSKDTYKQY